LAPSAAALYVARAAQGVGAALLLAPALAVMGHAFHEEQGRARAWAVWGGIMGLTMVLSPMIGGVINTWLGWRWAFYVNIPVCGLLAAAVVKIVQESRDPTPRSLDVIGIVLFAGAMFALTWALILGPTQGWGSAPVLLRGILGVVLFCVFGAVERRREHPMLDLALFSSLPFVGAVIAMFAYAASAQVMASLLPLFLQNARGDAALAAGVGMLPFAIAMLALPYVGRRLSAFLGSREILGLGLVIVALGNVAMVFAAQSGSTALLIAGMAVLGSGGGLLNGETQKAIMSTVPRHRAGMGSGLSTTARFSGILLGFTGLGAALAQGVRRTAAEQMAAAQLPSSPELLDRLAVGDLGRALEMVPGNAAAVLTRIARESYGAGFANAFTIAAAVAGLSAVIVLVSMRRRGAPFP
jgi:MFS family permease